MSKLSDELGELLDNAYSLQNAAMVAGNLAGNKDTIPGFKEISEVARTAITALLRSARLHYAGAAPWESGRAAIEATTGFLQQDALTSQVRIMCIGTKLAYMNLDCDYQKIINDKSFRFVVDIEALHVASDQEAMTKIAEHLAGSVVGVAESMGFTNAVGKETSHVWDVWYGALGSNSMSMYLTGVSLGRKRHEEEILNGIVQATQSEVSND